MFGGRSAGANLLRASGVSSEVAAMCTPVLMLEPTPPTSQSFILTEYDPLPVFGENVGFHLAAISTAQIFSAMATDSWSPKIPEMLNCVPGKGCNAETSKSTLTRDRGVLKRSNSAWATAAFVRASAKWDSACAACSFADLMSFSNESASCLASLETCFASLAMLRAVDDSVCARCASVSALPSDSWAFPALSIASPDLVSASFDWANAVADLIKASLVSASRDPIICPDKVSFLCPYGYATTSANTAIAKQHRPIFSKSVFFLLFVERCARISKSTSSAKNTSAAASKSLWTRLTESSEFQSGINVAKCILFACVLLGALRCSPRPTGCSKIPSGHSTPSVC